MLCCGCGGGGGGGGGEVWIRLFFYFLFLFGAGGGLVGLLCYDKVGGVGWMRWGGVVLDGKVRYEYGKARYGTN